MPNDGNIPRIGQPAAAPLHDTALTSKLREVIDFARDHSIPMDANLYVFRALPNGQREEWAIRDITVELTSGEPGFSAVWFELIDEAAPTFERD